LPLSQRLHLSQHQKTYILDDEAADLEPPRTELEQLVRASMHVAALERRLSSLPPLVRVQDRLDELAGADPAPGDLQCALI
jgi:hypothetical protein